MSANPQGLVQGPNQIQATQQTLSYYPTSILCNDDNTIDIDASIINYTGSWNPPISYVGSYIISSDSTAKVDCVGTGTTQITGDIDMQTGFIQNLGTPSASGDAVPLGYLQTNYSTTGQMNGAIALAVGDYVPLTTPLDQITVATGSLDLNSQKIISLADATQPTDAMNQQSSDARYYLNTTRLDQIVAPQASVSLNSQKITSLADATLATDALNRQTGDGRYYLNTTPLNSIVIPTNDVDINNNKLTNLKDGTGANDSVNFGQLTTTNTNLSNFIAKFNYAVVTIGAPNATVTPSPVTNVSGITSATKAAQFANPPHYTQTITLNYGFSGVPQIFITPQCTLSSPTGINYSFSYHILAVSSSQAQIVIGNSYVALADVSDLILNIMFIV